MKHKVNFLMTFEEYMMLIKLIKSMKIIKTHFCFQIFTIKTKLDFLIVQIQTIKNLNWIIAQENFNKNIQKSSY